MRWYIRVMEIPEKYWHRIHPTNKHINCLSCVKLSFSDGFSKYRRPTKLVALVGTGKRAVYLSSTTVAHGHFMRTHLMITWLTFEMTVGMAHLICVYSKGIIYTSIPIKTWISNCNYLYMILWYVISFSCPNFHNSLAKALWHVWTIASHGKYRCNTLYIPYN